MRKNHFRFFIPFGILFTFLCACSDNWYYSGGSYSINCLAVSGEKIYAGGTHGLYYSTDKGEHWDMTSAALKSHEVKMIAFRRNEIFVTTDFGDTLFKSADEGKTWTRCDDGLNGHSPNVLLVHENKIYAGAGDLYVLGSDEKTWAKLAEASPWITALCIQNQNLLIGTPHGIVLSENGGTSWRKANEGLGEYEVASIVPLGPHFLAACESQGIFISNEKFEWQPLPDHLPQKYLNAVVVNEKGLYAATGLGLFFSADTGRSWKEICIQKIKSKKNISNTTVSALAIKGNDIFVGLNYNGVYRSADNGNTWTEITTGIIPERTFLWGKVFETVLPVLLCLIPVLAWTFSFFFLRKVKKGKIIYFINLLSGITFGGLGLLIFSTRPTHGFDLSNAINALFIISAWSVWGIVLFFYSLYRRKKSKSYHS